MDELIVLLIKWIAGKLGETSSPTPKMSDQDIRNMQEVRRRMSEAARKNAPGRRVQGLPQQQQRQPARPKQQPRTAQPPRPVQVRPAKVARQPQPQPRRVQAPPPVEAVAPQARRPIQPQPAAAKSIEVNAGMLRRWLTPATLHKQFILTEILQPPVALRRERF